MELLFSLPPDLPTALVGDPLRLGQVLVNLGNNAVKFNQRSEIVIGARVRGFLNRQASMPSCICFTEQLFACRIKHQPGT